MTSFAPIFVPAELREATSDRAWLDAMLEVERALALAEAAAGVIPAAAASAIAEACRAGRFDPEEIAEQGRRAGNPAEPLVRALREAVGSEAERFVHLGATSQDVVDTAAMLVARRALGLVLGDVDRVAAACARLAREHRSTPTVARTLLQQAVPTTFGLKAAGWLVGTLDARRGLRRALAEGLAAQLGGAAGTLAGLGDRGLDVLGLFAREVELPEPTLPWHTNRVRVAELGGALAVAAGAAAKIGLDVTLLAQTEVGEVAEPAGRGGSSTMPQKRNPIGSALAIACARGATAQAAVLSAGLVQEHERAAGAWHAEWGALSSALALTGGAAASVAGVLEGLEVDVDRMRRNLEAADGLVVAERVASLLAERLGRSEAHELVAQASARAVAAGRSLGDELRAEQRVDLDPADLDAALDPATYLGSAEALVDRALERYEADG